MNEVEFKQLENVLGNLAESNKSQNVEKFVVGTLGTLVVSFLGAVFLLFPRLAVIESELRIIKQAVSDSRMPDTVFQNTSRITTLEVEFRAVNERLNRLEKKP